jgi:Protein of unknown function (DUF1822)
MTTEGDKEAVGGIQIMTITASESSTLAMPITTQARAIADRFARQYADPQKAEQVRLNTLAVCVVNDYLQLLAVPTQLDASDSWNPFIQSCSDIADLFIPELGYLECRPLSSPADSCFVPPEVLENRIGYVVVQLNEAEKEGVILGFCRRVTQSQLPLTRLQPIEAMISVLNPPIVQLQQWFNHQVESGWQQLEALLNPPQLSFASRSRADDDDSASRGIPQVAVERGRLLDLSTPESPRSVILTVDLAEISATQTTIRARVFPSGDHQHLFPGLELAILDQVNEVFQVAQAEAMDNYIQLQFNAAPNERFSIRIALADVSVTETFCV